MIQYIYNLQDFGRPFCSILSRIETMEENIQYLIALFKFTHSICNYLELQFLRYKELEL